MDLPADVFLLRMIDVLVEVPLHRPIATGRIGIQATARLHSKIGRFLHRLHGEIFGRVEDDRPLTTDPGDDRRTVFVVVPPTRLAFLAATTRSAAQMFFSALLRLPLLASGVIEVIRFHGALQLPLYLVGQGGIAQPPAPTVAGPAMDAQLSGNAARGTRQAQEKGGQNPVHDRALAAIQERAREVIEGALASLLFTAVAFQARLGVVDAPGTDVEALTAGTLEGPIFPAQGMDVGLTRFGVEEVVEMRHNRHG